MDQIKTFQEDWTIAMDRIQTYFQSTYADTCVIIKMMDENASGNADARYLKIGNVSVVLEELPDLILMRFPMKRTRVIISGLEAEAERIHRGFYLNFLSAGG